jgi:hypothetical protein
MAVVEFEQGTLSIDATVLGRGLNVEPSLVQGQMREGKITVLCDVESTRTQDSIGRLSFIRTGASASLSTKKGMPCNVRR